jgi:hypothetical protein
MGEGARNPNWIRCVGGPGHNYRLPAALNDTLAVRRKDGEYRLDEQGGEVVYVWHPALTTGDDR